MDSGPTQRMEKCEVWNKTDRPRVINFGIDTVLLEKMVLKQ